MKLGEVLLQELKTLEWESHYGGWIGPNRKVYYVGDAQHENFMWDFLRNMSEKEWAAHGFKKPGDMDDFPIYSTAFALNFVRFITQEMPYTFSIEGPTVALQKTFNVWAPTAMQAQAIRVDDITRRQYKTFYMPDMKAKFIQFVTQAVTANG